VKQAEDGILYWTINGEWLLNNNGEKIRATGNDGQNGITPMFKIEDNCWWISYNNGTSWDLLGKAVGDNGKDGTTPIIGVKQAEDGIWYWTINGEWMLNANGEKIRAIGNDGQNGVTPRLKIEDNCWWISYNNGTSWDLLGKAVDDNGKDGEDGKDGDSFFSRIDISNNDYVVFYLLDGNSITVPRYKERSLIFTLGNEYNLTPNYPTNAEQNPWWFGESIKHKGFGSVCTGRNNELWLVTRVGNSHGTGGGNLYWSVSYDEGNTWQGPTKLTIDEAADGSEDLRDATIYYDVLSDRYYLIYSHQYGIEKDSKGRYTDYSKISSDFKVFVGYEPFETMYDISPGKALGDDSPFDCERGQNFSRLVRVGEWLYLPFYGVNWQDKENKIKGQAATALFRLVVNDHDPLSATYYAYEWKKVKVWEPDGDNETAFYVTYKDNGTQRFNMISRRGATGDGYYYYSDDGGKNWSEKKALGFLIAGGPTIYNFASGWLLMSREQSLSNRSNVLLRYSRDGIDWESPIMISDGPSGYCSFATLKSGKNVICYSKESANIGIQAIRELKVSEK